MRAARHIDATSTPHHSSACHAKGKQKGFFVTKFFFFFFQTWSYTTGSITSYIGANYNNGKFSSSAELLAARTTGCSRYPDFS